MVREQGRHGSTRAHHRVHASSRASQNAVATCHATSDETVTGSPSGRKVPSSWRVGPKGWFFRPLPYGRESQSRGRRLRARHSSDSNASMRASMALWRPAARSQRRNSRKGASLRQVQHTEGGAADRMTQGFERAGCAVLGGERRTDFFFVRLRYRGVDVIR